MPKAKIVFLYNIHWKELRKQRKKLRLLKEPEQERSKVREKNWSAQNTPRFGERTMTVNWIYCSLPAATLPPGHRVAPLVPSAPFLPVCRPTTHLLASHLCSPMQVRCCTLALCRLTPACCRVIASCLQTVAHLRSTRLRSFTTWRPKRIELGFGGLK